MEKYEIFESRGLYNNFSQKCKDEWKKVRNQFG